LTGKTEITKMLVAQVARLSQWTGEHFLQDRIVEVSKQSIQPKPLISDNLALI